MNSIINYTEYSNGNELNYKIYNLRGDVIKTVGANQATKSFSHYYAFGNHDDVYGSTPTDDFRANTKVEDDDNLLNEGKRFRHLDLGIFLTPDPLEYVDGFNPYIYCSQNPWGKWDPLGLEEDPGTKIFKGIQDRVSALKKVDPAAGRKAQHTFNENRRAFQQLPKEYAKASLEVGITIAGSVVTSKAALPLAKAFNDKGIPVLLKAFSKTCETISKITSVEGQTLIVQFSEKLAKTVLSINATFNIGKGMQTGEVHSQNSFYGDVSTSVALAMVAPQVDSEFFDAATKGIGVAINNVVGNINDFFANKKENQNRQPEDGQNAAKSAKQSKVDSPKPVKRESSEQKEHSENKND